MRILPFLPQVMLKNRPLHLTLFVTKRCNARCGFCFYTHDEHSAPTRSLNNEMTLDEYDSLAQALGPLLWLAFSGGEIFLRNDLPEISRLFYRRNRPAIMLYPTNGLMPETTLRLIREIARDCPQSVIAVKISLDAPDAATHDAMRGVPGAFQRAHETLALLSELSREYRNIEVGINTVFCPQNQEAVQDVITHVQGLSAVRTHTVSLLRAGAAERQRGSLQPQFLQHYEQAVTRLEQALHEGSTPVYGFRGARLKAAQDVLQRRLILRILKERRRVIPCLAGRLNLVVTETAEVYPCEEFTQEFLLGNLRETPLNSLLHASRAREIKERIHRECFCTHECYLMMNILFSPRQYATLLREYLRLA